MEFFIPKASYLSFEYVANSYFFTNGYVSIFIPNFITSKSEFTYCFKYLTTLTCVYDNIFYQILHVKGIGFKVYMYIRERSLYFLLGYNHICKYRLPQSIFTKVRKNHLLMYSTINASLNSVIYQIKHLRYPDPYRGKGIRYRFQIMKFKPGKQR